MQDIMGVFDEFVQSSISICKPNESSHSKKEKKKEKHVQMNVIQNVQVSTHFQGVCFFSPVVFCQKLQLASLDFSELACA